MNGVADRLRSERTVDEEVGDPSFGDAESESTAIFEPTLISDGGYHKSLPGDGGDDAGVIAERLYEAAVDVGFDPDSVRRMDVADLPQVACQVPSVSKREIEIGDGLEKFIRPQSKSSAPWSWCPDSEVRIRGRRDSLRTSESEL